MVTIQVNERSKAGRLLLEMAELFSREKKGVKVLGKEFSVSKNIPNEETSRAIKNAKKGVDVKKFDNVEELFEELGI